MTGSRYFRTLLPVVLFLTLPAAALSGQGRDTLRAQGLDQPVEIIRDRWGINHIYATNEHDLFFAQGYAAARDRLFQFEIWRRQATGTVAEILGRRELKRDIGARLHRFRGNMKQELAHYHPRGEAIITAFVAGINAYIDETTRDPKLLPLEFRLLGIRAGKWTPEVVVSRHQGLLANIGQELAYAQAVRIMGEEKVRDLSYFQGGDPILRMDSALDPALIGPHILELYNAFRGPLKFQPEDVVSAYRGEAALQRLGMAVPSERDVLEAPRPEDIGSNNWVVSGSRTQSGYPLMANDPHRAITAPSLRYWAHLVAPGWDVIGGGEPVLPGLSIGHNQYGAWGLTIFGNDSEDLYVYETNPANENQYRYAGRWEDMKVIRDTVPVKGEPSVAVELKYTRHGPVLYEDRAHHVAYALRAGWLEIGAAPYLASLRMDQAASWEEFREASGYNRIPAENMVWADRDGNIGWQAAGIQPLRRNFSGLVPVPGDGRYEWDGYLPILALPHVYNPSKGFWGTANHFLMPPNYLYPEAMHYTWADPYRISRIDEFLGSGRKFAVGDMMQLQQDYLSVPARTLVPLLQQVRPSDVQLRRAQELLLGWNHVLDKNSVPAGIYVAWERRLQMNMRDLFIPREAREVFQSVPMKRMIDMLLAPDGGFGANPTAARDALVLRSLTEAVGDLRQRLGSDLGRWRYGQEKYKHARNIHPLSGVVSAPVRDKLDVGTLPRGGNSFTIDNTGGADNQGSGGSFRIIADTENWDNSVGTNTPGQSGDPDSPHYRDLFPIWANGTYFPAAYSRSKVESVAASRTILAPLPATAAGSRD